MVSAKNVQDLNKRIEKIHTEKTKAETQQEMLSNRLKAELTNYANQFGINLEGKDIKETKRLILEEADKVVKEVEKEYDLKEKVVEAIEGGDYDVAYQLLGIEREIEEEEEVVETEEDSISDTTEDLSEEDDDFTFPLMTGLSDDETEESEDTSSTMELDDDDEEELDEEDEESDDDDDGLTLKTGNIEGQGISDAFGSMSTLEVEDDDDEDMNFGFGNILGGSKFGV